MIDFKTAVPPPLVFTINGVRHQVPRFLLPQMAEWMQELDNDTIERATKHLSKDEKAQYLTYHRPVQFDVAAVNDDIRSPQGSMNFLRKWLSEKAEPAVSAEVIEQILQANDSDAIRDWVEEVASLRTGIAITNEKIGGAGESDDPLASQPLEQSGEQSTGKKASKKSKPSATNP